LQCSKPQDRGIGKFTHKHPDETDGFKVLDSANGAAFTHLNKGTAAQWGSQARPLEEGEPGYDTETGEIKIGDGETAFANLPAVNPSFKAGDVIIK
jgi:hypothetical protein